MPPKEINILLLGLTGAGKSTTINAMSNYFRFSTFEEAASCSTGNGSKGIVEVIPTLFTLPHPQTGKEFVVRSSPSAGAVDANERQSWNDFGQSATLLPTGYLFPFGENFVLRVIDTAGIGDTEGIFNDANNYENIRTYLHCLKELHGIVIVIKGNEARKTTFLKYCIAEIFTHFHKTVAQNIVFCFTFSHTASGHYGPGEGYNTIKSLVENDIKRVNIKLELGKNAFFVENDAYRFLVAKKQGYPWSKFSHALHCESWNYSVNELEKMFKRILNFQSHNLADTIALINAKNINFKISESIEYLSQSITQQVADLKNYETEFEKNLIIPKTFKPNPKDILSLIKNNFEGLYRNHDLESKTKELKQEKEKIENICFQFVYFLKSFSMLPFNPYFNDYIEILLKQESQNNNSNDKNLNNLKIQYKNSSDRLSKKINYKSTYRYDCPITELYAHCPTHMLHWQKELSSLQNMGNLFHNTVQVNTEILYHFKSRERKILCLSKNENLFLKLFQSF